MVMNPYRPAVFSAEAAGYPIRPYVLLSALSGVGALFVSSPGLALLLSRVSVGPQAGVYDIEVFGFPVTLPVAIAVLLGLSLPLWGICCFSIGLAIRNHRRNAGRRGSAPGDSPA